MLTRRCLEQRAGRVPIVVTVSHFATQVVEARAREAAAMGAAMVMMMPPYHGAALRADEEGDLRALRQRAARPAASRSWCRTRRCPGRRCRCRSSRRMAREIEEVKLFKIETPQAAAQAPRADRGRRRRHRGAVRRRGGDHADGRPRRRRHRLDDLGDAPRPDRAGGARLSRRRPGRGRRRPTSGCCRSSTSRTASAAGARARW